MECECYFGQTGAASASEYRYLRRIPYNSSERLLEQRPRSGARRVVELL